MTFAPDATPVLRLLARRRLAQLDAMDPAATQRATLCGLLREAAATRFGRAHGFAAIADVADYQRRVAPRTYEQFWAKWWRDAFPVLRDVTWPGRMPYFANSSGTTGGPTKRIPVSRAMVAANRAAALDILAFHVTRHPQSRLLAGRNLILGGSTALETLAPGIAAGDLSGIASAEVPLWARHWTAPPRDLALLGDWDRKMAAIAPASLRQRITGISGTPSWMLLFFERVAAMRGATRLTDCFPLLELVIHGGVGFAPYRERFAQFLAGSQATTREVYAASEGFFAIADRADGEGMRLILDRGIFYEFIRPKDLASANPDRRWIGDAETGVEYALVVSTNAGLWSYIVGDTVTLIDRTPPRLLVTGRTAWSLSIVGEHLIGQELDAAIAAAAAATGTHVADYIAAALPPEAGEARAGHLFVVELSGGEAVGAATFARALDADLRARNEDYAAHRAGDVGMRPPRVIFAPAGRFAAWMATRGKLGGQNKVPRVITDPTLLRSLLAVIER
jgi:hypothetical protein